MPTPNIIFNNVFHIGNSPVPSGDAVMDAFVRVAKKHGCTVKVVGDNAYRTARKFHGFYKHCKYDRYNFKTGDIEYTVKFVK